MADLTLNQIHALAAEGLGAGDIAEQLGLEVALVEAALAGGRDRGGRVTVSAEVAAEMLDGIVALGRDAESEFIRYRARQFIVDEFHGRHDKAGAGVQVNINIAEINDGIRRSRERILNKARAAAGVLAERVAEVETAPTEAAPAEINL